MKALVYNEPRNVSVKNVAEPKIKKPTNVLVKITSTNICGSDLHMYERRTTVECGKVLGHENLGRVLTRAVNVWAGRYMIHRDTSILT